MAAAVPFADGEPLALAVVGGRDYVRGLELIGAFERRAPGWEAMEFHFVQPMTCTVLVSGTRRSGIAARVKFGVGDARRELFIINTDRSERRHLPDPPLPPHRLLGKVIGQSMDFLVFGQHADAAKIDLLFQEGQAELGRRYTLRSVALARVDDLPGSNLLSVRYLPSQDPRRAHCAIAKNGRPWCRWEMVLPLLG